jgi:predicted RNA binding protein YcfA (HicA-like mRNA interferase family)
MAKLPRASSDQLCKVAEHLGFSPTVKRGSHKKYKHPDGRRTTITLGKKELPIGTLRKIVRSEFQISREEFIEILELIR